MEWSTIMLIGIAFLADDHCRIELGSWAKRADALHLGYQFRLLGFDESCQRLARRLVDRLARDLRFLLEALRHPRLHIANQNIHHAVPLSPAIIMISS